MHFFFCQHAPAHQDAGLQRLVAPLSAANRQQGARDMMAWASAAHRLSTLSLPQGQAPQPWLTCASGAFA